MKIGERQVAPTRDGIREDHVARYEWVADMLDGENLRILDVGCGVGYGAQLLAQRGHTVTAIDIDPEAIEYARRHYSHDNLTFICVDATAVDHIDGEFDAAVCFEMIEHVAAPKPMLRKLRSMGIATLYASVPNEDEFPFNDGRRVIAFHHRHYTKPEFGVLLRECGWNVGHWCGQSDHLSGVEPGGKGRTLLAACSAAPAIVEFDSVVHPVRDTSAAPPAPRGPKSVAILGLGPSLESYVDFVKRLGARSKLCDETWGINAVGDVINCDLVFHMDDVRVQEARAVAAPDSNIAAMLGWMRDYRGRIITSVPHDEYPSMEAFPLQDVIRSCDGYAYWNGTAAYAVAYAIHLGVERIILFGCDYSYQNSHSAEKGRACMEFWLGFAVARGIKVVTSKSSSLLDACEPVGNRLYGYDGAVVTITGSGKDSRVLITPHDNIPSAEEIEGRYDHSAHPNPIVQAEREAKEA